MVVVFFGRAVSAAGGHLNGGPPLALVSQEDGLDSHVLFHDDVHLEVELLVFCGQTINVCLEVLVQLLKPGVLLEDDLLPLDPHVPAPLGSFVVLQPSGPVTVILVLFRYMSLLPPLPGHASSSSSVGQAGVVAGAHA